MLKLFAIITAPFCQIILLCPYFTFAQICSSPVHHLPKSRSAMASKDRDNLVYVAKLAGQAKLYDEMVDTMKDVAKMDLELTLEERNLLSIGCTNVVGSRRESWRILSSIVQREESRGNEQNVKRIKEYRKKVETELTDICNDIVVLIDEHLIPACTSGESNVFYYKMKGDYYRYLAEFKTGDDKRAVADLSLKAYQAATTTAEADLPPTHPLRLDLALNFSVFYYDIMNSPERACHLAKRAFDEAISELDTLNEESFKDITLVMQFLRFNLTLWTSDAGDAARIAGGARDAEWERGFHFSQVFILLKHIFAAVCIANA